MIWQYVVLGASVLVLVLACVKKALNLPATILAVIMVLVSLTAGIRYTVFHVLAFMLISVVDRFCKKNQKYVNDNLIQRTGTRDAVQVFVNGGVAMFSVILWNITKQDVLLLCFTASLIESFGDSAASSIGISFGGQAYDICRFRKVPPGLSGGVTLAGTLGCAASCIIMSALAFTLQITVTIGAAGLLALAAFGGCLADSILGSLVQCKEKCEVCGIVTEKRVHCNKRTIYYSGIRWINNDVVNLLCNGVSALLISLFTLMGR